MLRWRAAPLYTGLVAVWIFLSHRVVRWIAPQTSLPPELVHEAENVVMISGALALVALALLHARRLAREREREREGTERTLRSRAARPRPAGCQDAPGRAPVLAAPRATACGARTSSPV